MHVDPSDGGRFDVLGWVERRREHVHRVASRSHVPLRREVLRALYLAVCVLVDGLVVGEVLVRLPDPWRWPAFLAALVGAVAVQWRGYRVLWPEGWDEPSAGDGS